MEREGWAPSPPIRDAATGRRGRTGRSRPRRPPRRRRPHRRRPRRALPAAPKANPDEVTRTLANLADLRDRGAITPEEYEAKKADLLSRL